MNVIYTKLIDPIDLNSFKILVKENIENIKDIDLLILKGHTLIEFALNEAIKHLSYKFSSQLIDYTFSQKIHICGAWGLFEGEHGLVEKLKLFGKIRNQIAHELTFKETNINNLLKYYTDFKATAKNKNSQTLHAQMVFIIAVLCGNIFGRLEIKIEINNFIHSSITTEKMDDIKKTIVKKVSQMSH